MYFFSVPNICCIMFAVGFNYIPIILQFPENASFQNIDSPPSPLKDPSKLRLPMLLALILGRS